MAFNSIDQLLNKILSQPQWQKQKRFYEVKKYWYQVTNHKVSQHTRPISIHNEILYIATSNAVWAQELSLQKRNLLRKLNNHLDEPLKNLHFASAQWHGNHLDISNFEDNSTSSHPSSINLASATVEKTDTPQEALEQWFQQIKNRSTDWQPCPRCQTLSPLGELKRWNLCIICFRDQQKS